MNTVFRFFTQNKYRKDITLAILIKLFALFVLWQLFFSHPVEETLDQPALTQHFLAD